MRRALVDRSEEDKGKEEIQRVIELMKLVQLANTKQTKKALETVKGNIYILPKPPTLVLAGKTSEATEGNIYILLEPLTLRVNDSA